MLPTNQTEQITFIKNLERNRLQMPVTGGEYRRLLNYGYIPYHLYFITDENPSKVGDWFIVKLYNDKNEEYLSLEKVETIFDCWVNNSFKVNTRHIDNCYKVIATTNDNININLGKERWVAPTNSLYDQVYTRLSPFPKPSKSFIDKFIEMYNKNTPITECLVEYETFYDFRVGDKLKVIRNLYQLPKGTFITVKSFKHRNENTLLEFEEDDIYNMGIQISHLEHNIISQLKVNSDNEITIKKVKDTFTREEVIEFAIKALDAFKPMNAWCNEEALNWINQNL